MDNNPENQFSHPGNMVANPDLQELIGKQLKVLDHGFIRLIDTMGDDSAIVQAARVSYGDGTKTPSSDAKLIDYLIRNKHTSPLEHNEIKLHVKCPLFVSKQWLRHRTANVNEISARYSVLPNEFYIPAPENVRTQSKTNKQGRDELLNQEDANQVISIIKNNSERAYSDYLKLVNEKGLTRELARTILPVNIYTEFYWKIDLHNLFHFIKLRISSHAQYEIRVYAQRILEIVKIWCPYAYQSFKTHILLGE